MTIPKITETNRMPLTFPGVPFILRATMLKMSSALRICHDEERWEIVTKSSMLNRRMYFRIGQEFSDSGGEARITARDDIQ